MRLTYLTLIAAAGLTSSVQASVPLEWTTDYWGNAVVRLTLEQGVTIRLNWTKPGGGTATTTVNGRGPDPMYIRPPAGFDVKNSTVEVKNKENSRERKTVYGWDDHPSYALAYHSVTGGNLALGGETFALAGSFQVRADSFDRDEASATFGEIHGRFLSGYSNITGVSASGHTLSFQFAEDQYYTTSIAGAMATPGMDGATSAFAIALMGTAIIDGSMFIPFTGNTAGMVTFTPSRGDSFESYAMNLSINTALGTSTGTMQSDGIVEVVPTPAAGMLVGLGGMLAIRRRR